MSKYATEVTALGNFFHASDWPTSSPSSLRALASRLYHHSFVMLLTALQLCFAFLFGWAFFSRHSCVDEGIFLRMREAKTHFQKCLYLCGPDLILQNFKNSCTCNIYCSTGQEIQQCMWIKMQMIISNTDMLSLRQNIQTQTYIHWIRDICQPCFTLHVYLLLWNIHGI